MARGSQPDGPSEPARPFREGRATLQLRASQAAGTAPWCGDLVQIRDEGDAFGLDPLHKSQLARLARLGELTDRQTEAGCQVGQVYAPLPAAQRVTRQAQEPELYALLGRRRPGAAGRRATRSCLLARRRSRRPPVRATETDRRRQAINSEQRSLSRSPAASAPRLCAGARSGSSPAAARPWRSWHGLRASDG